MNTRMYKKQTQSGFGAAALIAGIVVVGALGGGSWYVWRMNHASTTASTAKSQTDSTPTSAPAKPAADPYADWKKYCDTAKTACFRYPASWATPRQLNGDGNLAFAQNPTQSVNVTLDATDVQEGSGEFVTTSLQPLDGSSTYSVVGGYYTINNTPGYWITDTALVTKLKLQAGQHTTLSKEALTFTEGSKAFMLNVYMNMKDGAPTAPLSQTTAWPASADGQIAAKIAASVKLSD